MSTTQVSNSSFIAQATSVACAILMAIAMPIQVGSTVRADYESRIQEEKQKAQANKDKADELGMMAASYEEEVKRLDSEVNSIQSQINKSENQKADLGQQIKKSEKDIAKNSSALNDIVVDMYISSDVSPLEMAASSKSIGDFVDKKVQQESIQSSLNSKIDEINDLKAKKEKQKKEVERLIDVQKSQKSQLAQKQAEKNKLAEETRGEEDAYRDRAEKNNNRIKELRAAQAEENRRAAAAAMAAAQRNNASSGSSSSGSSSSSWTSAIPAGVAGGGGYPFVQGGLDYGVDPWGLYYRECVSYAAWKVASTGRFVPHFGGRGNANQWPSTVAAYGIQSGSAPRAGSVAMMRVGYYGHVMYVESVNGDGTITVSDYNLNWDGNYRIYTRSASNLTYIYF